MSANDIMNYKKKTYKWPKSSSLSIGGVKSWSYRGHVAREVAGRLEFKKAKRDIMLLKNWG